MCQSISLNFYLLEKNWKKLYNRFFKKCSMSNCLYIYNSWLFQWWRYSAHILVFAMDFILEQLIYLDTRLVIIGMRVSKCAFCFKLMNMVLLALNKRCWMQWPYSKLKANVKGFAFPHGSTKPGFLVLNLSFLWLSFRSDFWKCLKINKSF